MDAISDIVESQDPGTVVRGVHGTSVRVYPNAFGDVILMAKSLVGNSVTLSEEQVVELIGALVTQRSAAQDVLKRARERGVQ